MPASASSSIAAVADQVGGVELPDPVEVAADLREALAEVVDPRKRRGVRHGLVVVLTVAVCAVAAGARSFVAIAEWVADLPDTVAEHLGTAARCPSEATIRRVVRDVDADRFDAAIGEFVQQRCAALAPPGRRRALAIDGKTVRGSRSTGPEGEQAARHLLAVIDQHTRVVLGQVSIDTRVEGKTSEISRFAPLLDTLTALDLTDVVITADALHTQREHVETLAARGAHWVLTVKGNQCATRRSVTFPPQVGQTRREVCWVRWLTWIRKVKGTRACQETDDRAQVPGTGCRGTRAVWRKLDCLNPNLQRQQFTATGTAPGTGARRGRGVLVRPGHPSRRERCPTRAFKEMSGAPGPHYTCDRDERGITVPVRLAVTECS